MLSLPDIWICVLQDMETKSANMVEGEKKDEEEDEEILKRRISCHPLFGLLVESHLDCLKVGLGNINDIVGLPNIDDQANFCILKESNLDHFMEAYCIVLKKLKEAMQEPQQATIAFIKSMHSQLQEVTKDSPAPTSTSPTNSFSKKTA